MGFFDGALQFGLPTKWGDYKDSLGDIGNWLGFGKEGQDAGNEIATNPGYAALLKESQNGQNQGILNQLQNAQNLGSGDSLLGADAATSRQAVLNPGTSSLYASSQVMNNPLFAHAFGAGGLGDQLDKEGRNLSETGWGLQPQDTSAYGQASDAIARMFGQSQNSLMSDLQGRGMATGDNGVAGVGFSGLQGNKNEQLRSAQTAIANNRMNMNLQRLNAVRGQQLQLQNEAQGALGQQEGNNMNAVQGYNQNNLNALNAGVANQNQINQQFSQQQSTKTPTFGQLMGAGVAQGIGSAFTGGIIGGKGNSMGQNITQPSGGGGSSNYVQGGSGLGSGAENAYSGSSGTYGGGYGDNSGGGGGGQAGLGSLLALLA